MEGETVECELFILFMQQTYIDDAEGSKNYKITVFTILHVIIPSNVKMWQA